MKNKIVLLLLFSFVIYHYSFSQTFKSVFGKDYTQWNVIYKVPDYYHTMIYKTSGDTIINGHDYKILFKGNQWDSGNKFGYLREDTLKGLLWFLTLEKNEKLIMDLSLAIKDTFIFESDVKYIVDTIIYKSGKKYISFNGNNADSILFIEGIGPYNFLYFQETGSKPYRSQIRCLFKDDVLTYKNIQYPDCIDTVTEISKFVNQLINIYPNPAYNFITINIGENVRYNVEIYNGIGVLIKRMNLFGREPISVENLPSGVYYVRMNSKTEIYQSKFLKF